jgi:outer membrane lipoprotein-sorting protein
VDKIVGFVCRIAASSILTAISLAPQTAPSPAPTTPPIVVSSQNAKPEPLPETPKKTKEESPLEATLRKWAEADTKIRAMHVRFTVTDNDPIYEQKTVTTGEASIKKPDLWRVDLFDKDRKRRNVMVMEDKGFRLFDAEAKTEQYLSIPETQKKSREDGVKESGFGIELVNIDDIFEDTTVRLYVEQG